MLVTALSAAGALVAVFTLGAIAGFIHETIRLVQQAEREALHQADRRQHEVRMENL